MGVQSFAASGAGRHLRQTLAVAALLFAASAHGEPPIKVIVPIPPGGSLDILARVLAEEIGRAQGVSMIVENRPGADTIVGTEAAARAAPDGKTLAMVGTGFVINPLLRKTHYDPATSFEPICQLAKLPTVIAVSSKSPYLTLSALFDVARANRGKLTLGSIGPASTTQLAFEKLKREANIDMTFVPFPGSAPAFDAVLGQHVTAYFGEASFVGAQVKAGNLRALAVASSARLKSMPEVPTLAEAGFPDISGELWFAAFAPAKTPKNITERLATIYAAALQAPGVRAKLASVGLEPVGICGAQFARILGEQIAQYRQTVRDAAIKVE
jgi:tripartite-type tricarboxylate transporter receptor subunit TctC